MTLLVNRHNRYGGESPARDEKQFVIKRSGDPLLRLQRVAERIAAATTELAAARQEVRVEIRAASAAGMSLSAIGRVLGLSRQRVKMLRDEDDSA